MTRHRGREGRENPLLAGHRPLGCAMMLTLAHCSGPPTINVVGSYFPAWMLCILAGLMIAVCLRQLLVVTGLEGALVLPLLTHGAIATAATIAVWLLWFGH